MRYTRLSEKEYYERLKKAEEVGYLKKEIEVLKTLESLHLPHDEEDFIYEIITKEPEKTEEA